MSGAEAGEALAALLSLMERLRDPERGCPWDREQTFGSIQHLVLDPGINTWIVINLDDISLVTILLNIGTI